jgi:quercetin dioxygenase-like cupin family protein
VGSTTGEASVGEEGATYLHFEDIDWAAESVAATPRELIDAARASGARRKKMATGQAGFFMNHSVMPPGFTVPPHVHDHDELIVVIDGGCTILGGGPALTANDAVAIRAGHEYGFECGADGMRFVTIRTGEANVTLQPGS